MKIKKKNLRVQQANQVPQETIKFKKMKMKTMKMKINNTMISIFTFKIVMKIIFHKEMNLKVLMTFQIHIMITMMIWFRRKQEDYLIKGYLIMDPL